nr:hypothetical protein CFP56_10361 [Quercus suber]
MLHGFRGRPPADLPAGRPWLQAWHAWLKSTLSNSHPRVPATVAQSCSQVQHHQNNTKLYAKVQYLVNFRQGWPSRRSYRIGVSASSQQ